MGLANKSAYFRVLLKRLYFQDGILIFLCFSQRIRDGGNKVKPLAVLYTHNACCI